MAQLRLLADAHPAPTHSPPPPPVGGGADFPAAAGVAAPTRAGTPNAGQVKSCTQCGATKTPQWREGPLGPKTLCNACGVKQFRAAKRSEKGTVARPDDAAKNQRKPPSAPGSAMKRKAADLQRAHKAPARYHEDDGYFGYEPSTSAGTAAAGGAAGLGKRPVRRAAARATARGYDYLAGGDWVEPEDGYYSGAGGAFSRDSYTESGVSHQASDSAEEVVFEPMQAYEADPMGPAGPAPGRVAPETQAAVDLLTLSLRDAEQFNSSVLHPRNTAAAAASSAAAAANAAAANVMPPAQLGHPVLDRCAAGLLDFVLPEAIPSDKRYQAASLKGQLEAAFREVSAADAAVRAVARVLAEKQDASRDARHRAQRTANMLTSYLLTLDEQYELTRMATEQRHPQQQVHPVQHRQRHAQHPQQLAHTQQQLPAQAPQQQQPAQPLQQQQLATAAAALPLPAASIAQHAAASLPLPTSAQLAAQLLVHRTLQPPLGQHQQR